MDRPMLRSWKGISLSVKLGALTVALLTVCASSAVQAAEIRGAVSPVSRLVSIEAIDRARDGHHPAAVDWQSGSFAIRGIPAGCYDLLIKTERATIEGVNMRVGTQAGEPEEAPVPLLQKDRRRITEMVAHMKTFEDYKRILLLGGNAKRAKVLIELVRTGKTTLTSRKPFVTWRVEVWDYFKLYGSWRQKRGLGMVIRRQRIEKQNFNRLSWVFESKLGGLKLGAPDAVSKVNYEIPEVLSGLPGRWSGEESPIPEPAKEAGEAHNSEK